MSNEYDVILVTDVTATLFMHKPLGAAKLASILRDQGYTVLVLNHAHIFSMEEIKQVLAHAVSDRTLFIGFSTYFYQHIGSAEITNDGPWNAGGIKYSPNIKGSMFPHGFEYNREIKDFVREINPKCKFVLGGPDAKDNHYARDYDYVVLGYAERSIINLAEHLSKGVPLNKTRKSIFGPKIIEDILAEGYEFSTGTMSYTESDIILPGETLSIEISRGCIFKCLFCGFPMNGKKKNDYIKNEELLFQEFLTNYEQYGVTRYLFCDDTLNDSEEKISMILRVSKRLPFQLEYWAFTRLDLFGAYPHTIDMLYESGLRAMYCGIETLDETASKLIGKGAVRSKAVQTLNYIKSKYGDSISINGSFIFGLPGESIASMKSTAEMIVSGEIAIDQWNVYPLLLFENTTGDLFSSELNANYGKYGYKSNGSENNVIFWESKITSFLECQDLANDTNARCNASLTQKINSSESFYIAGLGFDLAKSLNKPLHTFNWHEVTLKKQERVAEYKRLLFKEIGYTCITS